MVKIISTTMVLCMVGISLLLSPLNTSRNSQFFYQNQVAVLMYHHVHDTDTSSSTVTTKLFRDQLQYLHGKGYHFITLTEFRKFMQGSSVPSNAVLVTFDDGYQSFYTNAFPILRELKVPAVNFIITGDLAKPLETYIPSMSMEQIADLTHSANNIDAQCHTDSMHSKLPSGNAALVGRVMKDGSLENEEQYKQRILQDTTVCRQKLASLYDQPVDSYAYPFGITNKLATSLIAEAGIRYAFTIIPEMATRDSDPLQIPRINAGSPNITPVMLEHTIERRIVRNIP